jgi:thiamine biosynthesis protein ThiI
MNCILIRYSEIGTKSRRTRRWWENLFMKNIQDALEAHAIPFSSIRNPPGRVVVLTQDEKALTILKNVFGISSLSFAVEIDRSMEKIEREALFLYQMGAQPGKTFRISTQRLDKRFYLTSQEVNAIIGAFIVEQENAQVNLDNPDIDIGVEIMYHAAYVFVGRTPGYGGLPVGVQGKVLVNLEDRKSAVAAWMMLKRGCELVVCGDKTILPYLEPFSYGHSITYVPRNEKAKNYLAIVFSELELEKRRIPSFYPLLALTEQQIRDIEALIFKEKGAE